MDILAQLSSILLLGFIAGAIPGPILTSIFTEVLRKGFFKSMRVMVFAAISEVIVASSIMILFFLTKIPQSVFYGISFVGAIVLIWLATQIWRIKKIHDKGELFNFRKIFLLTVFNGPLWIFWTTICVPQAFILSQKMKGGQLALLITFEIGWAISTVLLTFLFSRFRPLLSKNTVVGKVFKIFALILIAFAIRLAITSVIFFLK